MLLQTLQVLLHTEHGRVWCHGPEAEVFQHPRCTLFRQNHNGDPRTMTCGHQRTLRRWQIRCLQGVMNALRSSTWIGKIGRAHV